MMTQRKTTTSTSHKKGSQPIPYPLDLGPFQTFNLQELWFVNAIFDSRRLPWLGFPGTGTGGWFTQGDPGEF
jgi:hypothetical protein